MQTIPCTPLDEHESLLTIIDTIESNQKDVGKVIAVAERRSAARLERKRLATLKETEQIIDALLDEQDAHDIVCSLDANLRHADLSRVIGVGHSDGVIADYDDMPVDPRSYRSLPEIDVAFFQDGYYCPGNVVSFKNGCWASNKLCADRRSVNAIINQAHPNTSKIIKALKQPAPKKIVSAEQNDDPRYKWRFYNHFYHQYAKHWRPESLQDILEVITIKGESWFNMLSIENQRGNLTLVVTLYDKSQFYFDLLKTDNQDGCYVFNANGHHAADQQRYKPRCKDVLRFTATLETIAVSFEDMDSIRDNKNKLVDDLQINNPTTNH